MKTDTNIVRYKRGEIPPPTKEALKAFDKLKSMSDKSIDYSDIPKLDKEFFEKACRNPFLTYKKIRTTVMLDSDVLDWIKKHGQKGWQTRLNYILREVMKQAGGNVAYERY